MPRVYAATELNHRNDTALIARTHAMVQFCTLCWLLTFAHYDPAQEANTVRVLARSHPTPADLAMAERLACPSRCFRANRSIGLDCISSAGHPANLKHAPGFDTLVIPLAAHISTNIP